MKEYQVELWSQTGFKARTLAKGSRAAVAVNRAIDRFMIQAQLKRQDLRQGMILTVKDVTPKRDRPKVQPERIETNETQTSTIL